MVQHAACIKQNITMGKQLENKKKLTVGAQGRQRVGSAGLELGIRWIVFNVAEAEIVKVRVQGHPPVNKTRSRYIQLPVRTRIKIKMNAPVLDATRVFAPRYFHATGVFPLVRPAVLYDPVRLGDSVLVLVRLALLKNTTSF